MDYACRTRTLQSLVKDIDKGKILLSHKLQRKEGQWNTRQQSDLIDSLLRNYPMNPTYAIKENSVLAVIDGVQRLSTVRNYLSGKFALSKTLDPVFVNGEEKKIAGKKFNKLDEDTQSAIRNSELQIYELRECTEKDVREMFRRQNAGKPLSAKQLRSVEITDELNEIIFTLLQHPFMAKACNKTQRKNATDRDLVIQTLMLIETDHENEFLSFRSKDINIFLSWYCEHINEENISILERAMDQLNENYEEISLAITTIPMALYSAYTVVKENKPFYRFTELLNEFIAGYDNNQEYKQYLMNGTSSRENVSGRFEYFKNMIRQI